MDRSPWELLALYESQDYVGKRLRARHGGTPSDFQCREITAHVTQAREYFESGRAAGSLIRPLLIYYGVLTLSRALVLFSDPGKRSGLLSQAHGLEPGDWSSLRRQT